MDTEEPRQGFGGPLILFLTLIRVPKFENRARSGVLIIEGVA